jgi:glycosyltransferase involved in cell wall biosynthesis
MKIAVYTIAKNESQFVDRWYESAKDADYLLIADTGSTDDTVEKARALGINVVEITVDPWRFDVARQLSLDALPEDIDYCVGIDMDELISDGWRTELERCIEEGVTRPRYAYVWSHDEQGRSTLTFAGDKIHPRHGYSWCYPVHEVIKKNDGVIEIQGNCSLEIHHFPDPSKPRSQYLPLLELAAEENPEDARSSHYLAREYFFYGMKEEAEKEFLRHLGLENSRWNPERSYSMRYLYKITNDPLWLKKAVLETPGVRDARLDLARHHFERAEWRECLDVCVEMFKNVKSRDISYFSEDEPWGWTPHDLAAVSAYNLGYFYEALGHGKRAVELSFGRDNRILKNLEWYREATQG